MISDNKLSGIYAIAHLNKPGMLYIGSTACFRKRCSQHFNSLKFDRHDNSHLQNTVNKYGLEGLMFNVLEEVSSMETLIEKEQSWIDKYDFKFLFNNCPTASSTLGYKHTKETRKLLSKLRTGIKLSQEHIEKSRESNKGKVLTQECKDKISLANKGKKRTPEFCDAQSKRSKGKKLSKEHTEKIRQANLGNKHTLGHKLTEEHKRKIGEGGGKLNKVDVFKIKGLISKGIELKEIALIYDVNPSTISNIKTNKSWKHVPDFPSYSRQHS